MNELIKSTGKLDKLSIAQLVVLHFFFVLFANSAFAQSCPQQNLNLGTAQEFAVLAGSAVTNTGPSTIVGDIGISPGSSLTGYGSVAHTGVLHLADGVAAQAKDDLTTAYNELAGRPFNADLSGQDLGGKVLFPGVYRFSSSAQLTGTLTLDTLGDPNAVFVFQIGSTLTTASGAAVNVIGGAYSGIFWQVGSSATIGIATAFTGNVLAFSSITVVTGATINCGRALARNGAVTLDTTTIQGCGDPAGCVAPLVADCNLNGIEDADDITSHHSTDVNSNDIPDECETQCSDGIDNDGDGKIDFKTDGSGDPGCLDLQDDDENDNNLQSPAYSKFNTYLGQWNFAELINQGTEDSSVRVTVLNLFGQPMISRTIVIAANSEFDVDVNELVRSACNDAQSSCEQFEDLSATQNAANGLNSPDGIVDTYGLVRFDFDDTNVNQRLLGRMSFYRPNTDGQTFSFAFAREFRNPVHGKSYAISNTYNPQGTSLLVPNWAEIINFEPDAQQFTLKIYDQDGSLKDTQTVTIQSMGERDIQAGHEFVDANNNVEQGVYLIEVVPADRSANYFLSVSRYSSNSPQSVDPGSYNYAFSIDSVSGNSKKRIFAPIGNKLDTIEGLSATPTVTNWVEMANVDSKSTGVIAVFRNEAGEVVGSYSEILPPKTQRHFNASAVLPNNQFGTVEILGNGKILAQSVSYVHGSNNDLQTAFSSPARIRGRAVTAGTINTFLQMQAVLRSISTNTASVGANFDIESFRGGVSHGSFDISSGGAASLQISNNSSLNFPADTYGVLEINTTEPSQALLEVNRSRVVKGVLDFVMPTLVQ